MLKIRWQLWWLRLSAYVQLARLQYPQRGRDHIPQPMLRETCSPSAMRSRCPDQGRAWLPDSAPKSTAADNARVAKPHPASSRLRVLQLPMARARPLDCRMPAPGELELPASLVPR